MFGLAGRRISSIGFCGLFGFLGISYFFTGNLSHLFAFSFFAFFSFFVLGKPKRDTFDERTRENVQKAASIGFMIAAATIFMLGFLVANFDVLKELVVIICVFGWVAAWHAYAISFWLFERA